MTTSHLDGEIRDGRHHMQIRVYYEDADLAGVSKPVQTTPCSASISSVLRAFGNPLNEMAGKWSSEHAGSCPIFRRPTRGLLITPFCAKERQALAEGAIEHIRFGRLHPRWRP